MKPSLRHLKHPSGDYQWTNYCKIRTLCNAYIRDANVTENPEEASCPKCKERQERAPKPKRAGGAK